MKKLLLLFINLLLSINVIFAQLENRSFEFDGLTRNYNVFLPQNYQPNMPVVITLHAATMTMERMMGYSRMNDVADTAGFIVVYPAGIVDRWNWDGDISQGDDVGFISALIDTLDAKYNIAENSLHLDLKPSKIMFQNYKNTLSTLVKTENGEFTYDKTF